MTDEALDDAPGPSPTLLLVPPTVPISHLFFLVDGWNEIRSDPLKYAEQTEIFNIRSISRSQDKKTKTQGCNDEDSIILLLVPFCW